MQYKPQNMQVGRKRDWVICFLVKPFLNISKGHTQIGNVIFKNLFRDHKSQPTTCLDFLPINKKLELYFPCTHKRKKKKRKLETF